jgi:hypothetical protein
MTGFCVSRSFRQSLARLARKPLGKVHFHAAAAMVNQINQSSNILERPPHVEKISWRRHFSTEGTAPTTTMTESEFNRLSEVVLEDILEMMDGIEAVLPDADITLAVSAYVLLITCCT